MQTHYRHFHLWSLLCIYLSHFAISPHVWAKNTHSFSDYSLSELEAKKREIHENLNQLASLSLRGGMGAVGFRSPQFNTAYAPYWLQIDLDQPTPIDQVILTPVLWRDSRKGEVIANAFPIGFRVVVGNKDDSEGAIVAEFSEQDQILPRIAPLVIDFPEQTASWVRIETTHLSSRIENNKFVFQIAEIQVFQGPTNVALRRKIKTSHKTPPNRTIPFRNWFTTNGSLPYSMNAASGERSFPYLSPIAQHPDLFIDLGEVQSFSRIRLHAVEQTGNIPQESAGDLGMPQHLQIYGSDSADFSDATLLLDFEWKLMYSIMPIMEWAIPEVSCRYIKLHVVKPSPAFGFPSMLSRVGFAEIELIQNGTNVALHKKAWDSRPQKKAHRLFGDPSTLTDGRNLFGTILPMRVWMNQLAHRHDLNRDLKQINALLDSGYANQKNRVQQLKVVTLTLVVIVVAIISLAYHLRIRNEMRVRERIAANLHDELGANLHAIGILGELAEDAMDDREELMDTLGRIRKLTKNTGIAAYRCASMMKAKTTSEDLVEDLKREADRMLAGSDYKINIETEAVINSLRRRTRVDLMLYFKECLVNIIRHSEASFVDILLTSDRSTIYLTVKDNGVGIGENKPNALRRRAKLLRGKLTISSNGKESGSTITLTFKKQKWNWL